MTLNDVMAHILRDFIEFVYDMSLDKCSAV